MGCEVKSNLPKLYDKTLCHNAQQLSCSHRPSPVSLHVVASCRIALASDLNCLSCIDRECCRVVWPFLVVDCLGEISKNATL
jgi:hypothetical protein